MRQRELRLGLVLLISLACLAFGQSEERKIESHSFMKGQDAVASRARDAQIDAVKDMINRLTP